MTDDVFTRYRIDQPLTGEEVQFMGSLQDWEICAR